MLIFFCRFANRGGGGGRASGSGEGGGGGGDGEAANERENLLRSPKEFWKQFSSFGDRQCQVIGPPPGL